MGELHQTPLPAGEDRQVWQTVFAEMRALEQSILDRCGNSKSPGFMGAIRSYSERRKAFGEKIVKAMGKKARNYAGYYVTIGSTPKYELCPHGDTPGDLSVLNFLNTVLGENHRPAPRPQNHRPDAPTVV